MMTRTVKDPQERRQEIIQTARQLFAEKSYEAATMRDVMEVLDIAKGTIYHYFASKEDLLEAVIEETVTAYVSQLEEMLARQGGSGLEKLKALILTAPLAAEEEDLLEHLHQPGNMGMHARQLAVTLHHLAPLYAEVVQQGVEEGLFTTRHPLEAAELILAGVQFLVDQGIAPWKPEEIQRRMLALPDLVEGILGAQPGCFNFLLEKQS